MNNARCFHNCFTRCLHNCKSSLGEIPWFVLVVAPSFVESVAIVVFLILFLISPSAKTQWLRRVCLRWILLNLTPSLAMSSQTYIWSANGVFFPSVSNPFGLNELTSWWTIPVITMQSMASSPATRSAETFSSSASMIYKALLPPNDAWACNASAKISYGEIVHRSEIPYPLENHIAWEIRFPPKQLYKLKDYPAINWFKISVFLPFVSLSPWHLESE